MSISAVRTDVVELQFINLPAVIWNLGGRDGGGPPTGPGEEAGSGRQGPPERYGAARSVGLDGPRVVRHDTLPEPPGMGGMLLVCALLLRWVLGRTGRVHPVGPAVLRLPLGAVLQGRAGHRRVLRLRPGVLTTTTTDKCNANDDNVGPREMHLK